MEIITYIVHGSLTHQDSMGSKESLGRGSIQFMTAGTGVTHSEFNHSEKPLRFIQTWIVPRERGCAHLFYPFRNEYLTFFRNYLDRFPVRNVAMHFIVDGPGRTTVAKVIQSQLSRTRRIRSRVHAGSWMEIQYSLRRYGIDIGADWLEGDVEGSPFSCQSIEHASQEYFQMDEEWKRNEAPYCDPSSDIALYPNPQDIIMGKYRHVTVTWPGNLAYHGLIKKYAIAYGLANNTHEKLVIVIEILQRLKTHHQARFLTRKEEKGWEALSNEEARSKISHSLRDEVKRVLKPLGV